MSRVHVLLSVFPFLLLACTSTDPVYNLDQGQSERWDKQARNTLDGSERTPEIDYSDGIDPSKESKKEAGGLKEDGVQIRQLVERALESNQDVRSARERWKAAVYSAKVKSGWPDPKLMSKVAVEPIQTRDGPIDWQARLTQKFPWFGKLDAKEKRQLANAGKAYSRYQMKRSSVKKNVKSSFAEYRYLYRATEIVEDMRGYLDRMEDGVREAYESGEVPVHDLLRLENENEELETKVENLNDRKQAVRATLNQLLDRPADANLGAPAESTRSVPDLEENRLREVLIKHRPEIGEAWFRERAARQALRSAHLAYYPDFSTGLTYSGVGDSDQMGTVDAGSDAYGVQLTIDLPLWQAKRRAGLRSARAEKRSARRQMEDEKTLGFAKLSGVLAEFREHDRRIDLFTDTIVPNAERSLSSAREKYESGEMDIVSFLDFQNQLLRARLDLRRARADRRKSVAELEELIGISLDSVREDP